MFGDFGPSQRHRIPREHSPFGSFNRSHPMFADRNWEDSPMQRSSADKPKETGPARTGGHVERIIPIKIIRETTPPTEEPNKPKPKKESIDSAGTQSTEQPAPPIPLGWPTPSPGAAAAGHGEPIEKKYAATRHNTTDNLSPRNAGPDNQRAKSEPPNAKWTTTGSSNGDESVATSATAVTPPVPPKTGIPNPVEMTQLGGKKSKLQENGDTATGCRNIPIVVEGRGSGIFCKKNPKPTAEQAQQPQPSSTFQKTRSHPDCPESNTPPPPPKKITKDTMQIIEEIITEVKTLETEVNALPFTPKTAKNYIYLDEMLTRNLIKLDTIETEGREDIRLARRDCIKLIQKVINVLEGKSQQSLVAVNPPQAGIKDADGISNDSGSVQLALTPSTCVTTPVLVTAEAAMDIGPSGRKSDTEPMDIDNNAATTA